MPKTGSVILSISMAIAISGTVAQAYSDKVFRVLSAAEYAHQSSGQVTIGAKPYDSEELTAEACVGGS